jgi:hypothetical protein
LITSAAALLAGTVLAAGQERNQNAQPGAAQEHQAPKAQPQAPKAQTQGPREQKAPAQPNNRAQEQRPSTTGQGQREEAPAQRREGQDTNRRNEERREGQDNNRRDRTQGQNENRRNDERREGQDNNRRDRAQGQNDRDRNQREEGRNPREERREGQENRNNRDRTQGQGAARPGTAVTFSTEQRTKIRETILVGDRAPRVNSVNFSINIGTAVPRSVHLVTVPSLLVEYHPAWRGFLYFVYEDQIIVVDPRSHEIVAVLDV